MRMPWRPALVLLLALPTIAYAQPCPGLRPNDICETRAAADGATERTKSAISKPTGPSRKVSSAIRAVPSQTRSTQSVRVNRAGEIQVYVELKEFRPEHLAQLETLGLRVEGSLPEFRLVQGWIAGGAVEIVAGLDFVKQVRPPAYGMRESVGLASTEGDSLLRLTATPAGFSFSQSNFFQFTFPAGLPAGTYTLFAALFRNRSLADNVMDNGDLIGLSAIPIVYSP